MTAILRVLTQLEGGMPISAGQISDLIKEHKPDHDRMVALYERYKVSIVGVPIFTRTFLDQNKINCRLNNAFFNDIVDTKVGYMFGKPITYSVREDTENKPLPNRDELINILTQFSKDNNLSDLDSEAGKFSAICGYVGRLCYLDPNGKESLMNIKPWECIFLSHEGINEPKYALRYYLTSVLIGETYEYRYCAEFYTDTEVITFISTEDPRLNPVGLVFEPDPNNPPRPHGFALCPLIGVPNNEELKGDCEKVLSLIDAYDRTISDESSELEQLRLAYMAFIGYMKFEQEDIDRFKKTGVIGLDKDCDVKFITKDLNDTAIQSFLDRIKKSIYYFAGSVCFEDESFSGNASGVALKFKIFNLEAKCISMERKFTAAIMQMFRVLSSKWRIEQSYIDINDIDIVFTRNFPLNLMDEAQTTQQLKGMVSEKTRLSQLSFVTDVDREMEAMEEDNKDAMNLEDINLLPSGSNNYNVEPVSLSPEDMMQIYNKTKVKSNAPD